MEALPKFMLNTPGMKRRSKVVDTLLQRVQSSHTPAQRAGCPRDLADDWLSLHASDPQLVPEANLRFALSAALVASVYLGDALNFAIYAMASQPSLYEKLRSEADALFEHGEPTAQDVRQLDVIRRVYLETLRLYATVPRTVRTVANSFEFSGCTVPACQQVILDFTLTHHLPEFFPEPEQFDINRFAPPRNEHLQTAAYMPYGVGTHRCLGEDLAEFVALTAMATLLHDVRLELDPPDYTLTGRKIKKIPTRRPGKSFRFRLIHRRSGDTDTSSLCEQGRPRGRPGIDRR